MDLLACHYFILETDYVRLHGTPVLDCQHVSQDDRYWKSISIRTSPVSTCGLFIAHRYLFPLQVRCVLSTRRFELLPSLEQVNVVTMYRYFTPMHATVLLVVFCYVIFKPLAKSRNQQPTETFLEISWMRVGAHVRILHIFVTSTGKSSPVSTTTIDNDQSVFMMNTIEPVFRIIPTTQNYDWGKKGNESKVAEFASGAEIPGFTLNESTPYAEVGVPEARVCVRSDRWAYNDTSFGWVPM